LNDPLCPARKAGPAAGGKAGTGKETAAQRENLNYPVFLKPEPGSSFYIYLIFRLFVKPGT
jgi:hypothetical protein